MGLDTYEKLLLGLTDHIDTKSVWGVITMEALPTGWGEAVLQLNHEGTAYCPEQALLLHVWNGLRRLGCRDG
eukprot:806970-Alexandrium_andersonii.AAC.1